MARLYDWITPGARHDHAAEWRLGGFGFSAKIDTTTAESAVAAGEVWAWQQRIEAQDLQVLQYGSASAESLVCTFKIKSPKSGTHCVALYQPDATRSIVKEFTVASANTEEEITVVFTGDASGTINNDTGEGLRLTWPLVAGSTYQVSADAWAAGEDYATSNQQNLLDNVANNFEITAVRLRLGAVATARPFVHRPFGEELRSSQRYFAKTFDYSVAPAQNTGDRNGCIATTGDAQGNVAVSWHLPVEMRAQPNITTYNPNNTNNQWHNVDDSTDEVMGTINAGTSGINLQAASLNVSHADDTMMVHAAAEARL